MNETHCGSCLGCWYKLLGNPGLPCCLSAFRLPCLILQKFLNNLVLALQKSTIHAAIPGWVELILQQMECLPTQPLDWWG